jgi:hypothetical protein
MIKGLSRRSRWSVLGFAAGALLPQQALAWDAVITGKIIQTATSLPTNLAFRVTLDNGMSVCPSSFAYINTAEGNFQVTVANLLTAFSLRKTVTLYIYKDQTPYCRIVDVEVVQ